ncbi:MAG: hypothetical protein PHC51_11980 [bacterium]|nr:hypothetical protein [bacterium]
MRLVFIVLASLFLFSSCGGGGLHPDAGPAVPKVHLSKEHIDSGDVTEVKIDIGDISSEEFIVKVRYPLGLSYVYDTSFFEINRKTYDTGPDHNLADSSYNYLVYFLNGNDIRYSGSLELNFELRGVSEVAAGFVEVDIDLDDLEVSNLSEFTIADPRFTMVADAKIRVDG